MREKLTQWLVPVLNEINQPETEYMDVLLKIESQQALSSLKKILVQFLAADPDSSITNLNLICDVLAKRSYICYFLEPETRANYVYKKMAEVLASLLKRPAYTLLMPQLSEAINKLNIGVFDFKNWTLNSAFVPILKQEGTDNFMYLYTKLAQSFFHQFSSLSALAKLMQTYLSKSQWKDFLTAIDTSQLHRIAYGNDNFFLTVQRESLYHEDDHYNRLILFCLTEAYWRERENKDTYTSNIGGVIGSINFLVKGYSPFLGKCIDQVTPYSKEIKGEVVNTYQEFLMSDYELNELEVYLKANNKLALLKPMENGDFSFITSQAKKLCKRSPLLRR